MTLIITIAILSLIGYFLKWLTPSGSVAAFFVALILTWGGVALFYLPLLLLVGGTLLTKLNKDSAEQNGRNATQVFANGGIGICCLLFFYTLHQGYANIALYAYVVSFCMSICDTFSSEIGKYFKGKTVDILSLRPIQRGLSGGISIVGTMGGFIGTVFCGFIAYCFLNMTLKYAITTAVFGFAGMLLDSILGSALQAKYRNENGGIEEIPSSENKLMKGYAWCTNNAVNFISNLLVVLLFIVLQLF